jgi:dGTPase
VVKIADGVAYINHDLDDAIRAGFVTESDVPPVVHQVLGATHAARINTLVCDIVAQSMTDIAPGRIGVSPPIQEAADALREFLFDRVYAPLNQRPDTIRAQHVVRTLFAHFVEAPDRIAPEYRPPGRLDPPERQAADYVASMTDRYAVDLFQRLYVPRYWSL